MKKKFVSYQPARLRKGKKRWDIIYFQTPPGGKKWKEERDTYNLNRIKCLHEREKKARALVKKINELLPLGYPYLIDLEGNSVGESVHHTPTPQPKSNLEEKIDLLLALLQQGGAVPGTKKTTGLPNTNIVEAMELAKKIKMQSPKRTTCRSYENAAKLFVEYLQEKKLHNMAIGEFEKPEAIAYCDYWSEKSVMNNTWNNKLAHIRSLFAELKSRGYMVENPFSGIREKPANATTKDVLTIEEMKTIAPALKTHNFWLYWAACFAYYCLIRQEELSRLKFHYINIAGGYIHLNQDVTKNHYEDRVDIPRFLLEEMKKENFFQKAKANWFIFGKGMQPSPDEFVEERAINKAHRRVLEKLKEDKGFVIRKGVSFASWRKTGFNHYDEKLTPREQEKFYRHRDANITKKYLKEKEVIETVRALEKIF